MNHFRFFCVSVVVAAMAGACSNADFGGGSGSNLGKKPTSPKAGPRPPIVDSPAGTVPNSENAEPKPLISDDGGNVLIPDLATCATLPAAGQRSDGKCEADSAVVIINDGRAGGMTCCPIGKNIFSSKPEELNVERDACAADEVATGVVRPRFYCSKINTAFLKLEPAAASIYLTGGSSISELERAIARSYHLADACLCRAPSVIVGPHTQGDNRCTEQCALIKRK